MGLPTLNLIEPLHLQKNSDSKYYMWVIVLDSFLSAKLFFLTRENFLTFGELSLLKGQIIGGGLSEQIDMF